jgi:hypothetical protein
MFRQGWAITNEFQAAERELYKKLIVIISEIGVIQVDATLLLFLRQIFYLFLYV